MSAFSNLLISAVLFFALGFLTQAIKSDLRVPQDLAKTLSIYLLVAIGIHGGYELGKLDLATAFNAVLWAIILGSFLINAGCTGFSCSYAGPGRAGAETVLHRHG